MQLEDWLDDLCVRFIINLPPEELESVERICFQVEEAQWFYEDFIRPLDPSLPSLSLKAFSLRIFKHCPLFSEWTTENYTAAFAEFLAYKSRVPVRGAIMLNQDMDQVVLVRGWKKGSNWSFPRGKINKDEDDLECAIREVFEETGLDLKVAGLVRDAAETKSIEITMREQHMRLYVFRGIPMDTHFEPQTRKEIGKIEWYKLNELPTLRKNKQHEGAGDHTTNANKFYMVAPFLVQLKKWISQQKKLESRHSQNNIGSRTIAEEPLTDYETPPLNGLDRMHQVPDTLPEATQLQVPFDVPTSHLKNLLNLDQPSVTRQSQVIDKPHVDAEKSSALLALLRNGSRPDTSDVSKPSTPFEPTPALPDKSSSAHQDLQQQQYLGPQSFPVLPLQTRHANTRPEYVLSSSRQTNVMAPTFAQNSQLEAQHSANQTTMAPYQRTGDPEFSRQHILEGDGPRVPPASALPPLTSHTRALLDAFKKPQYTGTSTSSVSHQKYNHSQPAMLSSDMSSSQVESILPPVTTSSSLLPALPSSRITTRQSSAISTASTTADHRANLLGLFQKQPAPLAEMPPAGSTPKPSVALAELSAYPTARGHLDNQQSRPPPMPGYQYKHVSAEALTAKVDGGPSRGYTSATISGPLNQPQFEGIARTSRRSTPLDQHSRSPVAPNKTLFDPNQGPPKKILTRSAHGDSSPGLSPRRPTSKQSTSSRRPVSRKGDEAAKAFQPQILRRPIFDQQGSFSQTGTQPASEPLLQAFQTERFSVKPTSSVLSDQGPPTAALNPPADDHKQALLSLFIRSNSNVQSPETVAPRSPFLGNHHQGRPSISPAASLSGIVSPITDSTIRHTALHQISVNSSDSLTGSTNAVAQAQPRSSVTTGTQPLTQPLTREKRKTTAESDKAFLLGYLGKMASQKS